MDVKQKEVVVTKHAPDAIGCYSQAIRVGDVVYTSGQIGLDPNRMEMVSDDFLPQAKQSLDNLAAVIEAAGASLSDVVKLNVYLTDMSNFPQLNDLMSDVFQQPYPARATVQVAALPKSALFEVDAVVVLTEK